MPHTLETLAWLPGAEQGHMQGEDPPLAEKHSVPDAEQQILNTRL